MRISDDRYSRDRVRLDLALRFIRHEARTQTIRAWTGLTDDRIRKLYRSYFDRATGAALPRPRGRSPRRASFFLRNPRLKQEAALIASLCLLLGALPRRTPRAGAPAAAASVTGASVAGLGQGVPQGIALCEVYEAYRALVPAARISFEHLVYLLSALSRGDELTLASCAGCGAVLVAERMALKEAHCPYCADIACERVALRV
ncbi:MAG: hypothetical protein ACREUT_01545 [Steroidobacteraceae bacterium]